MDTDSFILKIKTEDFYADIAPDIETRFDTSAIPKSAGMPFKSGLNKKVPGLFKDEMNGNIMMEFWGMRSKCYACKTFDGKVIKKSKGFSMRVIDKEVTTEDYDRCLKSGEPLYKEQRLIRNRNHHLETVIQRKKALSCDGDKRILQDDGITTLTRGHFNAKPLF